MTEVGERLKRLIASNAALYSAELGTINTVTHTINTGDHPPVQQHPYRTPFVLREQVARMIDDMPKNQVIQPSSSPWASSIVLVEKKDKTLRFYVDHCRLNAITKMDVFPLPRVDDTLDLLAMSKYFTTFAQGIGKCRWKKTPEKAAFITHSGLYEFTVMPFGCTCNAPAADGECTCWT